MGEGMQAPVFHGAAVLEASLEGDEDSASFSSDSRDHDSTGSSLSDLTDDATSSFAGSPAAGSSPSGHPLVLDACGGPLCELSSLMDQLPIKRGLSKFFSGKSQSFTSISNVRCVEDLAKKETQAPHKISRRMSSCRSTCFAPGPCNKTAISKRSPRGYSCASSLATTARRSSSSRGLFCSSKPAPPLPVVHKDIPGEKPTNQPTGGCRTKLNAVGPNAKVADEVESHRTKDILQHYKKLTCVASKGRGEKVIF